MDPDDYDYPDPMHDGSDSEPPPARECSECGEEMRLSRGEWWCGDCGISTDCEPPERHWDDPMDEDYPIDGVGFADPGGNSALRAATRDNPRDRPCPTCGRENVLTRIDVQNRYQCDRCADQCERGAP